MSQYCDVCMEHAEYMCECGTAFYCGQECQIDSWENAHRHNHDVDVLVEGKGKKVKIHTSQKEKPTPKLLHVEKRLFNYAKDGPDDFEGNIFFLDGRQTINWIGNPEDEEKLSDAMEGLEDAPLNMDDGVPILQINFKDNYVRIDEGNHRTKAMTSYNYRWVPYRIIVINDKKRLWANTPKKRTAYKNGFNQLPKIVKGHRITNTWIGSRDAKRGDLEAFGIIVLDFNKEYAPDEYKFDPNKD